MRRALFVGLGVAVLSCSLTGSTQATPTTAAAPVVVPPSAQLEDAGRAAMELVDGRPAEYTGAELRGRDNRLTIALPGGARLGEREAAARRHLATRGVSPDVSVDFTIAQQSQATLERQKERILAATKHDRTVSGIGEDSISGIPIVYLTKESPATEALVRTAAGPRVRYELMPAMELSGGHRRLSESPHWGGAGYWSWAADHQGDPLARCSTGFPISVSGTWYMMTAGHCMPGATPAPAAWAENTLTSTPDRTYYFGSVTTTTVGGTPYALQDGTQDLYGDWALLHGAVYKPIVFTGGVQTTVGLYVGAADYNTPAKGSQVCSSGRTTGSICRYFVHDGDTIAEGPNGIRIRVATIRSDQDLNGAFDCAGWDVGDSGGAILQGLRPGWARVLGVATSKREISGQCYYRYSPLRGVRAWNPNATVPFYTG